MSDWLNDKNANTIDFGSKVLSDELKEFKKYKPVFIPCLYNRDKVNTFKEMIKHGEMTYDETVHTDYSVFLRLDGYDLKGGY